MRLLPFGDLFAVLMIVFFIMSLSSGRSPDERRVIEVNEPELLIIEPEKELLINHENPILGVFINDYFIGDSKVKSKFLSENFEKYLVQKIRELEPKVQVNHSSFAPARRPRAPEASFSVGQLVEGGVRNSRSRISDRFNPKKNLQPPDNKYEFPFVVWLPYSFDENVKLENCGVELSDISHIIMNNECIDIAKSPLKSITKDSVKKLEINGVTLTGFGDNEQRKVIVIDSKSVSKPEDRVTKAFGLYCRTADAIINPDVQDFKTPRLGFYPYSLTLKLELNRDTPLTHASKNTEGERLRQIIGKLVNNLLAKRVQKLNVQKVHGTNLVRRNYLVDDNEIEGTLFNSIEKCNMVRNQYLQGKPPFKFLQEDKVIKTFSIPIRHTTEQVYGLLNQNMVDAE